MDRFAFLRSFLFAVLTSRPVQAALMSRPVVSTAERYLRPMPVRVQVFFADQIIVDPRRRVVKRFVNRRLVDTVDSTSGITVEQFLADQGYQLIDDPEYPPFKIGLDHPNDSLDRHGARVHQNGAALFFTFNKKEVEMDLERQPLPRKRRILLVIGYLEYVGPDPRVRRVTGSWRLPWPLPLSGTL